MGARRAFEPGSPDFRERVRESFGRQRVMGLFGARILRIEPGRVDLLLPFREDLTQQHGFLHAGVTAAVVDSACGYAALTLMPADAAVLSIEYKVNMLAPGKGDALEARAHVVRAGRNVTVCTGEGWMRDGRSRKQVACMTATLMTIRGRGIEG